MQHNTQSTPLNNMNTEASLINQHLGPASGSRVARGDPISGSWRGLVLVSNAQNYDQLNHGSSVMRSGIIFQFSNTVMFVALILVTIFRLRMKGIRLPSVTGWPAMVAMRASTVMVFVHNAYRIAELSGGWKGHLMRTEWNLIALDMGPMAVAVGAFVVFSPFLFFFDDKQERKRKRARLPDCIPLSQVYERAV